MNKRMYLFLTATVILAALAVLAGFFLHISALSHTRIDSETAEITEENTALETRLEFLRKDVEKKTDNSSEKEALNKKITDLSGEIAELTSEIDAVKSDLSKVKSDLELADNNYNNLKNGINPSKGSQTTIENSSLLCPAQLNEGRYIATGSGTLTVTSVSGSARIAENLSTVDTSSYTFNLETGEKVSARGSVTITKLK